MQTPLFLIVDLFCGAGGTTTGFAMAKNGIAKVIACVNHDAKAIESHWKNHPEVKHFEEDIRTLDLTELVNVVKFQRSLYPDAKLILWASLECTNFSNAKGGQPRDADSRTLAETLYMKYDPKKNKYTIGDSYIQLLNPDYVMIENVVEFMSWGPLDEKGKPISREKGIDFERWKSDVCKIGYYTDWNKLNSADFGAHTSRKRLFGVFAKHGLPIAWPEITHAKNPEKFKLFGNLKKWKPVKEVLDFTDEGKSIFNRKKPLSDKTLERINAGLVKYVANGDISFISKYYSGRPAGKVSSIDQPGGTITTAGNQSIINVEKSLKVKINCNCGNSWVCDESVYLKEVCSSCGKIQSGTVTFLTQSFLVQRNSGNPDSKIIDIDGPARTLTSTGGNQDLVQAEFLLKYNSTDKNGQHYPPSVNEPSPVLTTQNRLGLIQPQFLINYNHSSSTNSIEEPAPTLVTRDKIGTVKTEYFIDKHYGNHGNAQNQSINDPAGAILPNDKHRLVEAVPFIMPTSYDNLPKSVNEPAPTIHASRRHHYIVNPSHGGHSTSVDAPCPVIVARQDKAPLYLLNVEGGYITIPIYDDEPEIMHRIKIFMAHFGLKDIKMRMLHVHELLKIQGFPDDYTLCGNQSDKKKFIGNSVVPQVVKVWIEAMADKLIQHKKAA